MTRWVWAEQRAAQTGPTKDAIAAAVKAVKAMPAKFPTPWPRPKQMPTISDVDFRDVKVDVVQIADLMASNKKVKRDKVLWHVQNPGKRMNPTTFTKYPLVLKNDDGMIIVDGHHFLAAQQFLGEKTAAVYLLPSK